MIVGAGPAGLAAAIRLKQCAPELGVMIVEKSAEIGGHILSGAVMNPVGLDELIPDWRARAPQGPAVTSDHFHVLTAGGGFEIPSLLLPPLMKTPGAVIVSLSDLVRWLAEEAQGLGVDIYPMTAASDLYRTDDGAVQGIITGDLGRDRSGQEKPGFAPGIAIKAKYTLLGEGARGSLAKGVIRDFGLDAQADPQLYALGLKEIWEVPAASHSPGRVDHFLGHPLGGETSGGGFLYHAADRRIYLGLVVHLNYANPTLSPYDEFQRFKAHPTIAAVLEGATRLSYGARALTSGGLQSIPDLAFPGGALIGCAAGFMNLPALKGIHSAIRSGRATAEAVAAAIAKGRAHDVIEGLNDTVLNTGIGAELRPVRNVKPLWARFGTLFGVLLGGVELWCQSLLKASPFGTLRHTGADYKALRPLESVTALHYPVPRPPLGSDRNASVFLANISHDDDQPVHLRLADPAVPVAENLPRYGEPARLYCPAGVYEVVTVDGQPVFRINAQNCVHCKTCDIKDPAQNITWVPPEGGSGPNYAGM